MVFLTGFLELRSFLESIGEDYDYHLQLTAQSTVLLTSQAIYYLNRSLLAKNWKEEWREKWTKCVDVTKWDDNKLKITIKQRRGFFGFFRGVSSRTITLQNSVYINVSRFGTFAWCYIVCFITRHSTIVYKGI